MTSINKKEQLAGWTHRKFKAVKRRFYRKENKFLKDNS